MSARDRTTDDPLSLRWHRPWVTRAFPCPHCHRSVATTGHEATKTDLFGHDLDVIVCPEMKGWQLVHSPRDRS